MCRYILDTDCVSLILYNHPRVTANAAKHQVAVTIVTVQELFNGWVIRINDPSQVHNLPSLYSKLWTTVKYIQTIEILDFLYQLGTITAEVERRSRVRFLLKRSPQFVGGIILPPLY